MELLKGKTYFLIFLIDGHSLGYTALITDIDDRFVSFTDKFGENFSYALSTLISKEGPK